MFPRLWSLPASPWLAIGFVLVALIGVRLTVDLSPQVETDFFFSEDDPQLATSREIDARYPSTPQIILRIADESGDASTYADRIADLTGELLEIDGIGSGYSISTDDPTSPLFRRILLNPDGASTNIILQTDGADPEVLIPRLEASIERFDPASTGIIMSGVPVIVELIRRNLFRDLVVFSAVAFLVFGGLVSVVYRDPAIVGGTLTTCLASVATTLLLIRAGGVAIGLLTANIVTIVFVITLSHIVFMTANWRREAPAAPTPAAGVAQAVRATLEPSFWSMITTLLGFLSLLLASARPLRELGIAGALGTLTALGVAYALYPIFLARWARVPEPAAAGPSASPEQDPQGGGTRALLAGVAIVVIGVGLGVPRLDTDPGLLTYFAPGSGLRTGLELVDGDGGSSTLNVTVSDADGRRIDDGAVYDKLWAFQDALEADPAVGVVVSPAVIIEHGRTQPLARLLPISVLLDLAEAPELGRVGLSYVRTERDEGRYFLRMRESVGAGTREEVMARVGEYAREAGLEPTRMGGLYDLQAQLGRLIASSLRVGLGGLMVLFCGVAFIVSRSVPTSARMVATLAGIPLVVLGTFGHLGVAIDIITSPAANVALAMGVDSMIHLVTRVRTLSASGLDHGSAWRVGRAQIAAPVLSATLIICMGFGIFGLSTFPPTRRFGLAVILGTGTAALMALLTLPRWASLTAARTRRT